MKSKMNAAESSDANPAASQQDRSAAPSSTRQGRVGNFVNLVHYIGQVAAFHLVSAAADAKRHNLDHVALLGLCGSSIPLVINTVFGCKLCGPTLAIIEVLVAMAIGFRVVWRSRVLSKHAGIPVSEEAEPVDVPEPIVPIAAPIPSVQAALPNDTAARISSVSPTAKRNKVPTPPQCKGPLAAITCPLLRAGPLRSLGSSCSESEPTVVLSDVPRVTSPSAEQKADGSKRRRNTVSSKPCARTSSVAACSVVMDDGLLISSMPAARGSLPDTSKSAVTKSGKTGGGFSTRCATSAMLLRAFGAHSSKTSDIIS